MTMLSRVTGGVTAERPRGEVAGASLTAGRFKLGIRLGAARSYGQTSIDAGCVAVLVIAVLVQGIVVALGLPHKVELLGDLAATALLVWALVVVVRSRGTLQLPYLAIALGALLVVAALRSEDLARLVVSARTVVLLPTLALALGVLGARERRNRAVLLTVILLAALEFALTIVQALTIDNVDLVDGTFGDYSGPSTAFAILTGACLALGIYGARMGGVWWLGLAIALPVFSIWASIRAVLPIAPVALLAVAVPAWWASASSSTDGRSWRQPLAVATAAVLCGIAVIGGYAVARPKDFGLFTNPSERSAYLSSANVFTRSGDWVSVEAQSIRSSGQAFGQGAALSVVPFEGATYAGGRAGGAEPLRAGRTYSFLAYVRTSAGGDYQLWAGAYRGSSERGPVTHLTADERTPLHVQGVRIREGGPLLFVLSKPSGSYAGSESIAFDCITVVNDTSPAQPGTPGKPDCGRGGSSGEAGAARGETKPLKSTRSLTSVPGRGTQYRTAARLIDGSPVSALFGNGLGATTYAENLGVEKPPRDERIAGYSDFGTLVVELGWLGVLVVAACAVALGLGSCAAARRAAAASWTRALLIGYPGVVVTMAALAFFGTPFRNIGSATIFWVLTGLVLASILGGRRDSGVRDSGPVRDSL